MFHCPIVVFMFFRHQRDRFDFTILMVCSLKMWESKWMWVTSSCATCREGGHLGRGVLKRGWYPRHSVLRKFTACLGIQTSCTQL